MRRFCVMTSIAAVAWAAGCATTTQLTNVWKSESYTGGPMNKLLVIAIAKEPERRKQFEDAFVVALVARGVEAQSSYLLMPEEGELEKAQIQAAIRGRDFQGVIVTRLLEIDTTETYVPPRTQLEPIYRGTGLYGYYGQTYQVVHDPGFVAVSANVRLETNLFGADDEQLIWTAHSDTLDPVSIDDVIHSVTSKLTAQLASDGLIPGS